MNRLSMKLVIRIAALTITFLTGCVVTYVFNRVYVRFEKVGMGSIRMESGARGSISSYLSSDGVELSFERLDFPSTEEAKKAFDAALGASNKIISRELVHDRDGKFVVGERVFALFPFDGKEWPIMVCLDGTKLYDIKSTSLRHILIFEKRHRRY